MLVAKSGLSARRLEDESIQHVGKPQRQEELTAEVKQHEFPKSHTKQLIFPEKLKSKAFDGKKGS